MTKLAISGGAPYSSSRSIVVDLACLLFSDDPNDYRIDQPIPRGRRSVRARQA